MNAIGLVLLVVSIVFGAFGVVFAIESIKQRDKKRTVAYSVGSFFAAVALGLASTYAFHSSPHKGYTYADYVWKAPSAFEKVRTGDAVMTAMMSTAGTSGTVA